MAQDIYDPLEEYVGVFAGRFKEVAERTFDQLAKEAHADAEVNRATCRQLYEIEAKLKDAEGSIALWQVWRAFMWVAVAGAVIFCVVKGYGYALTPTSIAASAAVALTGVVSALSTKARVGRLTGERDELRQKADALRAEAWAQMEPLNRLYDWDVLTRMMAQTIPRLEFDPYFTTQRLADLEKTYGWDGSFNKERSVVYSQSGLINGNPFVICRTRKMQMGEKTYTGTKTITWSSRERGSDGQYHTVHHSQVLTATVTAPYPEYFERTRLIYGNTAAPGLTFTRKKSGMASKEGSIAYRWKRRKLRKKARDLTNSDFAMLTNEDFEVAFDTSDRDNNQQFALLFTPLAQQSMLKLLKDHEAGYGDDFDFLKQRMINVVVPDHLQSLSLDLNPAQFTNFDFDKAKANFLGVSAQYFRAIYFSLAPLLCVPMYQQIRPPEAIYGRDMRRRSAFWEHEALANFWGQEHFQHSQCVTKCILKTEQVGGGDGDDSAIMVTAYGYRAEPRLTYVSCRGGDGRSHRVPVHWDEYLPVTGYGAIQIREDNDTRADHPSVTQTQRLSRIRSFLGDSSLKVYRRHIASSL